MGNLKTLAQGKNLKRMLAGLEQEIASGVSLYAHRKLEQTVGNVTPMFKITHSNVIVYHPSHENIGDIEIHTLQPDIMEFDVRSEDHTSELQSRFALVCRLLLE